ncbi:MAG: hypothetical protein OXH96_01150, partial [Spirochaetaceae bacterium]|nr:hypothetical protein [Spirochaetaceae bacterium]
MIDLRADEPFAQIRGGGVRRFAGVVTCIEVLFEIEYHREHEYQSVLAAVSGGPLGVIGGKVGRQARDELFSDSLGILLRALGLIDGTLIEQFEGQDWTGR